MRNWSQQRFLLTKEDGGKEHSWYYLVGRKTNLKGSICKMLFVARCYPKSTKHWKLLWSNQRPGQYPWCTQPSPEGFRKRFARSRHASPHPRYEGHCGRLGWESHFLEAWYLEVFHQWGYPLAGWFTMEKKEDVLVLDFKKPPVQKRKTSKEVAWRIKKQLIHHCWQGERERERDKQNHRVLPPIVPSQNIYTLTKLCNIMYVYIYIYHHTIYIHISLSQNSGL